MEAAQLAAFRTLLRDVRRPQRLRANALARTICSAEPARLVEAFLAALHVSLHRLTPRQREIVDRYDLKGERVEAICTATALSRRQFFRDHRAAVERLAAFMVPAHGAASAVRETAAAPQPLASHALPTPGFSLATGLRSAGAYDDALAVLAALREGRYDSRTRIGAWLEAAEIGAEQGDVTAAQRALAEAKAIASREPGSLDARLVARFELVEGHLAPSHSERQARYGRALAALCESDEAQSVASDAALAVRALHALSLSHDHCGDWLLAREAARRSAVVAEHFRLGETPAGLLARANYAMRDARQFGNADAAAETLWACLGASLRNGWITVTGDVAVHFINVNLMQFRYARALAWRRWISAVDAARLGARTRNFLAVDSAHALTMLGQPSKAIAALQAGDDEGLAFAGATEYWRAEAMLAAGDAGRALALGERALDGAADARSPKGRARSKRLLAKAHHALGHRRAARKTIAECLELSERYVSPYDLLLSLAAARRIDRQPSSDEAALARLLRGLAADADYRPPGGTPTDAQP